MATTSEADPNYFAGSKSVIISSVAILADP